MPIKPEFRQFYGREWRKVIRPRILKRANNKCEDCGAPNHQVVLRTYGWWTMGGREASEFKHLRKKIKLEWRHAGTEPQWSIFPHEPCHWTGIVLTVAHLNHTPGDDRDENLKAMCQWCHLNYDKEHHRETRAARKDAGRPILETLRTANEQSAEATSAPLEAKKVEAEA
jgi:hypothetical protein